ncbi:hypothetical protein NF27_HQ00050 [Candidatus Jidaibacter acanthamoeba]|uniref:Uncharacterized protein n=1 Tax=Candidatus Jidaibacter acanthamoebae TaxID=86105 RepID=A0A0C1MR45_9RICK|nr:hypothetical protein [Candidatus Jidaibacter acanthamoeba]KIE04467.1 hypothetical protein NF27_HQ00050 [Candidatus Jidaibacter acanthamoeba]
MNKNGVLLPNIIIQNGVYKCEGIPSEISEVILRKLSFPDIKFEQIKFQPNILNYALSELAVVCSTLVFLALTGLDIVSTTLAVAAVSLSAMLFKDYMPPVIAGAINYSLEATQKFVDMISKPQPALARE